ncbi:hypothetical protein EU527_15235 [Candidatus Thorarchaeota archaeon]|nr:MAG: hypothetical protein EU527_15235 [Candidatus Thorarchaeota archaeon]
MSAEGAIPPSIKDALDSDMGYVLMVTGNPGTGKSLFVQELFREYDNSFLILSNAEIDTPTQNVLSSNTNWKNRHAIAHCWRNIDSSSYHDLTLKQQLSKLLDCKEIPDDSSMIIIDSWSDFIMPIELEKRYEIQQSLIYAAKIEGKKIVFVVEGDCGSNEIKPLDHSADAIIRLEKLHDNNRMYRQMFIDKMRSWSVKQDKFLFTLDQGQFSFIPWYKHQFPPITVEREPIKDPSKDKISTGNKSLDIILGGGFERGMLSLIEIESLAVPYLETVYIPFLSNHLQLKRPAVILLPEGWSPVRFIHGLSHFVDEDCIEEQVVFFGRHAIGTHVNVRNIDDDPWKTLQEIRYESSQLERKFGTTTTELFSLDTLENKYGVNDVKEMLAEITAALPSTNRTAISILSQQQMVKSGSIAYSVHLKVQELNGVLSVYGVIPRTNFLALRPLLSKGFLDYELIPIV